MGTEGLVVAGHVHGVPDWWPLAGTVQRMAQSSLQWPAQGEVELGGQLRGSVVVQARGGGGSDEE